MQELKKIKLAIIVEREIERAACFDYDKKSNKILISSDLNREDLLRLVGDAILFLNCYESKEKQAKVQPITKTEENNE